MRISIAYTIDIQGAGAGQFFDRLRVSLATLKKHKREEDEIVVHILFGNLSAEVLASLYSMGGEKFVIKPMKIADAELAGLQQFTRQAPNAQVRSWCGIVFARLFIPWYLHDEERVLYLDTDTMIRGSLHELYETDIGENYLGMVMGIVPEYGFNSGVMIFDCAKLRKDDPRQELNKHMAAYARSYFLPDQTVINRFYFGKIHPLPLKYNYPPMPGQIGTDPKGLAEAVIWHFYNQQIKPIRFDDCGKALVEWNDALMNLESYKQGTK